MSTNRKGSGETALMRRLARAFPGRLCDNIFSCAGSTMSHDIFSCCVVHSRFTTTSVYLYEN